jgi:hypothetical protein
MSDAGKARRESHRQGAILFRSEVLLRAPIRPNPSDGVMVGDGGHDDVTL